jgi:integrase
MQRCLAKLLPNQISTPCPRCGAPRTSGSIQRHLTLVEQGLGVCPCCTDYDGPPARCSVRDAATDQYLAESDAVMSTVTDAELAGVAFGACSNGYSYSPGSGYIGPSHTDQHGYYEQPGTATQRQADGMRRAVRELAGVPYPSRSYPMLGHTYVRGPEQPEGEPPDGELAWPRFRCDDVLKAQRVVHDPDLFINGRDDLCEEAAYFSYTLANYHMRTYGPVGAHTLASREPNELELRRQAHPAAHLTLPHDTRPPLQGPEMRQASNAAGVDVRDGVMVHATPYSCSESRAARADYAESIKHRQYWMAVRADWEYIHAWRRQQEAIDTWHALSIHYNRPRLCPAPYLAPEKFRWPPIDRGMPPSPPASPPDSDDEDAPRKPTALPQASIDYYGNQTLSSQPPPTTPQPQEATEEAPPTPQLQEASNTPPRVTTLKARRTVEDSPLHKEPASPILTKWVDTDEPQSRSPTQLGGHAANRAGKAAAYAAAPLSLNFEKLNVGAAGSGTYSSVSLSAASTAFQTAKEDRIEGLWAALRSEMGPNRIGCDDEQLRDMCEAAIGALDNDDGLMKGNASSDWKAWQGYCDWANILPWRTDLQAASGSDPIARQRETVIWINALLFIYPRMKNAKGRIEPPKPTSALAILRSIKRMHTKLDLPVVPLGPVVRAVTKLMEQYRDLNGAEALQPHRKEPLTSEYICRLLEVEKKRTATSVSARLTYTALWAFLAQTGFRKAEVALESGSTYNGNKHFSWDNIKWRIKGKDYPALTPALRAQLSEGDTAIIRPPPSKSDQLGLRWGPNPIYMPYSDYQPICAARELADLEIHADVKTRIKTPVFATAKGHAISKAAADRQFKTSMGEVVPAAELSRYSVHSFRIYLATALAAAGASDSRIQSMLRWASEDALMLYKRTDVNDYMSWVRCASGATFSTIRSQHLPKAEAACDADRAANIRIDMDDICANIICDRHSLVELASLEDAQ